MDPGFKRQLAKVTGIGRTSLYKHPSILASKDRQAIGELKAAHNQHPLYGVRRLALHLGWSENKARRIRNLAGVTAARPHKKYRSYGGKPEISAPANHLHDYALFQDTSRPQNGMDYSPMQEANSWVQDFTYLRISSGLFYLALVMDLSTREVLSWKLGTNHTSQLTHITLIQALHSNASPSILHSDRGSEYLSERHQATCIRFGIRLSAANQVAHGKTATWSVALKALRENLAH